MSHQNENKETRIGLWVAGGAAALTTLSVLLFALMDPETPSSENNEAQVVAASEVVVAEEMPNDQAASAGDDMAAPSDVAPEEAASAATPVGDGAEVVVENGVVKFYFASGKADLAAGAQEALKDVLAGVKEGKKAVVSGYHDTTGNQAQNEELSKQRALSVKNALLGFGVEENQIELRKPADSEGSGDNAEARRVEVILE